MQFDDLDLEDAPLDEDDDDTEELTAPVRWGILGPGLIARNAIMPAFDAVPNALVVAVASRDLARAQSFAADFGIPRAYADYAELLADPDVEAIYIALPNNLHAEWAIRAAEAGKHVLCEKPLAMNAAEAADMVAAADAAGVWLMEAVMYRFHPRMREVASQVQSGTIGAPVLLRASFCFTMADQANYRNDPDMGGGALLDVGMYDVNVARWMLGEEPTSVLAAGVLAESGIDATVSGILTFPSGALAHIQCSFASAEHQGLDIVGTTGVIEVARPFTAWRNDEASITIMQRNEPEEILFAPADPYAIMLAHFSDCVRGDDEPWMPPEDAIGSMRVLDALRRSLSTGRSERV